MGVNDPIVSLVEDDLSSFDNEGVVANDIVFKVEEDHVVRHLICFAWQRITSSSISVVADNVVVLATEIPLAATEIPVAP